MDLFKMDANRIEIYSSKGTLLDIGCAYGFFMDLMRFRGWNVYGNDLSEVAIQYASGKLGLKNISHGQFQNQHYPKDFFDVITTWYVLHHTSDPRAVLQKAFDSLKKNGIIAIRVPNHNLFKLVWWLKKFDNPILRMMLRSIRKETADSTVPYNILDPPVHLYAFSPQVLSSFLEDIGFSILGVFNDGMVNRGNYMNQIIDRGITIFADIIRCSSKNKIDLSISFSIYAEKR